MKQLFNYSLRPRYRKRTLTRALHCSGRDEKAERGAESVPAQSGWPQDECAAERAQPGAGVAHARGKPQLANERAQYVTQDRVGGVLSLTNKHFNVQYPGTCEEKRRGHGPDDILGEGSTPHQDGVPVAAAPYRRLGGGPLGGSQGKARPR